MRFADLRAHQRQQKRFRWKTAQRCFWCGVRVIYHKRGVRKSKNSPMQATREHVIPKSLGGGGAANIVVACRACNNRRGRSEAWVPFHRQVAHGTFIPRAKQGGKSEASRTIIGLGLSVGRPVIKCE